MADFDDFDDLKFKPVTKGLGFHQQEKTEVKKFNRVTPLEQVTRRDAQTQGSQPASSVSKMDLSAFYNQSAEMENSISLPQSLNPVKVEQSSAKQISYHQASAALRIVAAIIDYFSVILMTAVTVGGFALLLGKKLQPVMMQMPWYEFSFYLFVLYALFFLAYFTILDSQATIGKSIFGLQVIDAERGEKPSFIHSFQRALISLIAPLLLFLPFFLHWQDKVSETKVVQR